MASKFVFVVVIVLASMLCYCCDAFYIKPSNDLYDMKYGEESAELDDFDDIMTPLEQHRQNTNSYQRLL